MKVFKPTAIAILLASLTVGSAGCGPDTREGKAPSALETAIAPVPSEALSPTEPPLAEIETRTDSRAIFELEGEIYSYRDRTGTIEPLFASPFKKRLQAWSADRSKLLLSYYQEEGMLMPPRIGIYDLKENRVKDIPIDNDYAIQLLNVSWADDRTLVAEGRVNPSAEGYVLYDADSGAEINDCAGGRLYQVLPDGRSMLFRLSPHIFPEPFDNVTLRTPERDIRSLYSSKTEFEEIVDAKISADQTRIAIWTRDRSGQGRARARHPCSSGITMRPRRGRADLQSYKIAPEIAGGELRFERDGGVIVATEEGAYRLKEGTFRLEDPLEAESPTSGTDAVPLVEASLEERLQSAAKSKFGSEPEEIYWIAAEAAEAAEAA